MSYATRSAASTTSREPQIEVRDTNASTPGDPPCRGTRGSRAPGTTLTRAKQLRNAWYNHEYRTRLIVGLTALSAIDAIDILARTLDLFPRGDSAERSEIVGLIATLALRLDREADVPSISADLFYGG